MKCVVVRYALVAVECRSPCGERGLKFRRALHRGRQRRPSLPVRGAWVEIASIAGKQPKKYSRSPCGERGLKFTVALDILTRMNGRSPCGERGLKSGTKSANSTGKKRRSPCGERGLKLEFRNSSFQIR